MQRSGKLRSPRRLTLESLESRLPLAGNVTATILDGKLSIFGDAEANEIVIEEFVVADTPRGRFHQVRGLAGTTINGASILFVGSGQVRDILVNLGRGDDRIIITAVGGANGDDPIGDLIDGAGPVLVSSPGSAILDGQLKMSLSDGNDTAVVFGAAAAGMIIDAGSGNDRLYLIDDAAHDTSALQIRMGAGNDQAGLTIYNARQQIDLQTADGDDDVHVNLAHPARLTLHTGMGNDDVKLAWSPQNSPTTPASDRQIVVRTGWGNDTIELTQIRAAGVLINAGGGRDAVNIRGIDVTGDVTIHGGGLYGSTVKMSDYSYPPPGPGVHPAVIEYTPTHIGGSLHIDFSNEHLQAADEPATPFSVTLGAEGTLPGLDSSFVVDGRLRVFGTVRDDDIKLRKLTAARIELHGGDGGDAVSLGGVNSAGSVAVFLGSGDDRSLAVEDFRTPLGVIVPTAIGGDLLVDYGAGNDQFSSLGIEAAITQDFRIGATNSGVTSNFIVSGQLLVFGGAGFDDLQIVAATLGSANLQFGEGKSRLDFRFVLVQGHAQVDGSFADDQWLLSAFGIGGDLSLLARSGGNQIGINEESSLPSHVGGNVLFDVGNGNDLLRVGYDPSVFTSNNGLILADGDFAPLPGLESGGGHLTVEGRMTLTGRGGNDNVLLNHLEIRARLFAFLGAGDDVLEMQNTSSAGGQVDGGIGGSDRVEGNHRSTLQSAILRTNWEVDTLFAEPVATILLPGGQWHSSR